MSDLIERQAAIDAIGEYDFEFPEYMERFVTELRDAMKADLKHDIEALPSAQPEIIRCRECRYMHEDTIFGQCWCNRTSGCSKVNKDDFCSRAERKEE